MATISYTKLRDGSWGIRAEGTTLTAGDRVTVVKRSGESKTETVGKILWTGDGVTLATISSGSDSTAPTTTRRQPSSRARGRRSANWTGCYCGSIDGEPRDSDCWQCRHDS